MNKDKVIRTLSELVSIESVSTDPNKKGEIIKAVNFLKNELEKLHFEVKLIAADSFPPLLVAYKLQDPKAKTIGIYGHYDVQPEDPVNEWNFKPFSLSSKNGKFYGRGVADNKGHIVQNLTALSTLASNNNLKNNIVFLIEGEEEMGSVHFEKYARLAKDILSKVDVFYVTDMGMYKKDVPAIFYALRGIVFFELEIETGRKDLHSGIYGNLVFNPADVSSGLFSKIKDFQTNKVLIPGFYDDVREIPIKEKQLLSLVKRTEDEEKKEAEVYGLAPVDSKYPSLSSKIYPSLDVNGIVAGYTGQGTKTIIPRKITIKFSCRLVEHQDPNNIVKLVGEYLKKNMPEGVKYNLKVFERAAPFYTDIDSFYIKQAAEVLQLTFGGKTVFNRSGGSVPAAEVLQRLFKKPIILTGFILPDASIHAPDENFDSEMFWKGIEALIRIYST